MRIGIVLLLFIATHAATIAPASAAPLSPESQRQFDTTVKPFLQSRCYKCHDEKKTRAGFRIDTLGTDFLAEKTADSWKEIYDKLGLGKMPPEKEPRPTESEARAVTDWIDQEIRNAERLARNSAGRTRRLNRTEYFNTLRDLFSLDENYVRSLEDELPPDGKVDGFDRVGSSLYIDRSQLAKYVELSERVCQVVFGPRPEAPISAKDFARDITWGRDDKDRKWLMVTYLTDGFRTLPVRRAAYVKDVLWNEPAKPPPPNAGDLPAVKANLTVRQRLQQHRDSPSCASCHTHLDPFGIALENYDAIGKWRDHQNGEGFKGDEKSPPLDVSGTLPSGRAFSNLLEYKKALLEEKEHFLRGFTKKVLTYALGRSVGAADRETVDGIVQALEHDNYRMQSLIQAVVACDAFRMK